MNCPKCKKQIPADSIYCAYCGKKLITAVTERKTKTRGNGQGSVYKLPNGNWRAAVTLGYNESGKRVVRTKSVFKTKKEALAYLAVLKQEPDIVSDMKLIDLYNEWSERHYKDLSKSKETAYKIAYNNMTELYYKKIKDIKLRDLQAVIDARSGGYYPKHDMKVVLNLMFKYAIQSDYIGKNYAEYIKLPPLEKSKREAFTREEIESLWRDYERHGEPNEATGYILIMIYTGMRLGELQTLKIENIDIEKGFIIGGIKTDAGKNRKIAIADKIKPIIEKYIRINKVRLLERTERLFYADYYSALERADVRRLTPHSCRHTFATRMAEIGTQPAIIKAIAGHESYETTLQYTHISDTEKLAAVNRI